MVTVLGIVLFVVCCLVFYAFVVAKHSFSKKYTRQKQLLDQFNSFVASNRVLELNEIQVQKFMDDTADTSDYFLSGDILNMRHLLHDNAMSLVGLNNRKKHSNQVPESQTEIADIKKETLSWFNDAASCMNNLFEPEMKLNPSFADLWQRVLKMAGRAIRA